jgi:hypothetical protein
MAAQAQDRKPKPLGQPLDWSEQALEDLSQVGKGDIQAAESLWQTTAPAEFKKLLQAEPLAKQVTGQKPVAPSKE